MIHRILTVAMICALGSAALLFGPRFPFGTAPVLAGTASPDQSGTSPDQSGASNAGPAPTAAPAAATPAPSGTVLASDNFSNPSGGLFGSGSNTNWTWGYVNGEYQIASNAPLVEQSDVRIAHGDFTDQIVAADVHLGANADPGSAFGVGCRMKSGASVTGYVLRLNTELGVWVLNRDQAGGNVTLNQGSIGGTAANVTAVHHMSLTCQGTTISGSIDGTQVVSMQDTAYGDGSGGLYGYSSGTSNQTGANTGGFPTKVDDRFDNFTITQP